MKKKLKLLLKPFTDINNVCSILSILVLNEMFFHSCQKISSISRPRHWRQTDNKRLKLKWKCVRMCVSFQTAQPVRIERQQVISECCHLSLSAAETSLRWRGTHLSNTHSVLCQRTLCVQTTSSERHTHQGPPLESMCSVSDRIEWNLIENTPPPQAKNEGKGGWAGEKKSKR